MFELMDKYLAEASNDFDTMMMRVTSFTEAVDRTLAINYHEAELKVMQENGTEDALAYYYEAAASAMADNIRKSIDKIIDAIQKFFYDTQEKVIAIATDIKSKDVISNIEKKIKLVPLLGRKKVLVENYNDEAKVCDEAVSRLVKIKAKLKAGQEIAMDEISDVETWFRDAHEKVIGVAKAVPVTISSALDVLKSMTADAAGVLKKNQKEAVSHMKDLKDMAVEAKDPRNIQALGRLIASFFRTKTSDFIRCMSNIGSTIKGSVKSFASKGAETKESTDDFTSSGSSTDDKSIDNAVKEIEKNSGVAKEDGDDDGVPADPIDAVANDPWSTIMNDLGLNQDVSIPADDPDECGSECGPECGTEGGANCKTEGATDSFETLYKKIVGESDPSPSDDAALAGKPNNDKLLADIFKDVMNTAKGLEGNQTTVKPVEDIKESAFDQLMAELENL